MSDFKKLNEAIELMNAIKSTLVDNPKHVNEETRKQRYEQAGQVIRYLTETRFAAIKEKKKAEKEALTYEEKISIWRERAKTLGWVPPRSVVDSRETFNEQMDSLTF
jgi:hypothetical protein